METQIATCVMGSGIYNEVLGFARAVYADRHSIRPSSSPEMFAYSHNGARLTGCLGLYRGSAEKNLLMETYLDFNVLEFLSEATRRDRECMGELGMRAVDAPGESSVSLSILLSAELIRRASELGLCYLVFTSNRTICFVAKALSIRLKKLGVPDLSRKSRQFRLDWEEFFKVQQYCWGLDVAQAIPGCAEYKQRQVATDFPIRNIVLPARRPVSVEAVVV